MTVPTSPSLDAPRFREAIASRIHAVSAALEAPAQHLLAASGKGYRPIALRLSGEAFGGGVQTGQAHEVLADAIELVHVGSLIHDDILDDADTRRGVEAVHVAWNAKVAVLAGDYLLAQAAAKVASLDDPYLTRRLAEMITDLCEGELMQDEQSRRLETSQEDYLTRIAKKTASPFELACEGGARLSGARGRDAAVARRFGFHLGRLFQLVDDVLDWTAGAPELGKPAGRDLENGVLTLPVFVALERPEAGPTLRAMLTPFPQTISSAVRALVLDAGSIAQVRVLVADEADRARQWLQEFPAGSARDRLDELLDGLVARVGG